MICYLDSSALVKRYVQEAGSADVSQLIAEAEDLGTTLLTRTEVVAALAKLVRIGALTKVEAATERERFEGDWPSLVRLSVSESIVSRAADLAWSHDLRGYDSLHLATALSFREVMSEGVVFATYDRQLWRAARQEGLTPWPAGWGGEASSSD